jgi:hypothetical protein
MSDASGVSRRGIISGLGLMTLAPGLLAASPGASPGNGLRPAAAPLDTRRFRDFIRLRTAPDLAPVLWVYSGVLVVKPDGDVARPVARIEGLSRSRATAQADGSFLWELDEAGYYCDPATGRPADALLNPFTGSSVVPKHYRSPQALTFSPQGIQPARGLPPGVDFHGEITCLAEVAGTLAMTEDLYVKMPARPAAEGRPARPARFAASLATFTTFARNLQRPDAEWVDCQFNYTTLNSFVDWLGLADRGGVQDMRIVGIKCRIDDPSAVPQWLRARVKADHPDLL